MLKKGANIPNESEKQKLCQDQPSTSAAGATIGVAAMLSAVSSIILNQGASSIVSVSDSEDENTNVWAVAILNRSKVKSPGELTDQLNLSSTTKVKEPE